MSAPVREDSAESEVARLPSSERSEGVARPETMGKTSRPQIQRALLVVVVLVSSAPAAFVVTFLAMPLWSWIERRFGLEAVGHSGPATWCFEVVYATIVVVQLLALRRHVAPALRSGKEVE